MAHEGLLLANLVLLEIVALRQLEEFKRLPLVDLRLVLKEVCDVINFT